MKQRQPSTPCRASNKRILPEHQANIVPWKLWIHRYRTRRQLRDLLLRDPQRVVGDLGIPFGRARVESEKPFWR